LQASSDIGGPGAEAGVESVPSRVERLRAALARWIPEARENHAGYADGASTFFSAGATHSTVVAAVSSAQSGFIAALSLSGAPQLLVGRGTRVSTDLDVLVDVCSRADGEETISDAAGTERAVEMIYGWAANERAREAAGLVASTASQRNAVTRRIDALVEDAAPHVRASRLALAARARKIATTPQCAAVERELDALLQSDLGPDEWLQAISELRPEADGQSKGAGDTITIHAILLLRPDHGNGETIRRRSPSPRAPESP
ncbi:MAG: hypothetical protein ACJ79X_01100, partial [Gemmatimonadaceae bacterium]